MKVGYTVFLGFLVTFVLGLWAGLELSSTSSTPRATPPSANAKTVIEYRDRVQIVEVAGKETVRTIEKRVDGSETVKEVIVEKSVVQKDKQVSSTDVRTATKYQDVLPDWRIDVGRQLGPKGWGDINGSLNYRILGPVWVGAGYGGQTVNLQVGVQF